MNDLANRMRQLRNASPQQAGPACEEALLQAFRRQRRRVPAWHYATALAACLALSFGPLFLRRPPPAPRPPALPLAGFVSLPYGQGDVPLEQAVIVRVNFPSSGAPFEADFLIGQDGMARAVRWLK